MIIISIRGRYYLLVLVKGYGHVNVKYYNVTLSPFPERLSVYEVTGSFTTPICAVLVKLAIANIVKGTCATTQLYKETESHFLRVPDGAALFSKVLCTIFSTKIGVNCVPFRRE